MTLLAIVLLVLIALLVGIIIGWLIWKFRAREEEEEEGEPPRVPDHFDETTLARTLSARLAGTPADGSAASAVASPTKAVWVEGGDEVLVHLDSTSVRILDKTLVVSIDLESDQTGRTPLVVALALGGSGDPAGLIATTDELPRGNGLLAARWGRALQAAVWASLLGLSEDHASERNKAPAGITAALGRLSLSAGTALQVTSRSGGHS
jgi:hypothetical protein